MFGRTLIVASFFMAMLTGCATNPDALRTRAQAREEGLQGVSISGGACDAAGQYIPVMSDMESWEASAAPTP